jgi:hypothetical protein
MNKTWIGIVLTLLVSDSIAGAAERPNVVVIMADDMGYSDIGCFGGEIRTPHLDQLANGGLRFTNFYSENMCWVSRAALLTGVYHKTSMIKGRLHTRCETLPEALRRNGYQARMSGKWHLAGKPYHVFPLDRGYDEFYGILGGAASFFAPVCWPSGSHLPCEAEVCTAQKSDIINHSPGIRCQETSRSLANQNT